MIVTKQLPRLPSAVNACIVIDMKGTVSTVRAKIGRPLSFDRTAALYRAMLLFWQHGYEATSVSELTVAMGVTAPSLYTAFGDKKGLFLEAVEHYLKGRDTPLRMIDAAATARDAARALLDGAVTTFTGRDTPPGCLLASAAISCSPAAADMREELATIRRAIEARLCRRIRQDIKAGLIEPSADAAALAGHITAVVQGLSTLARDGASREKLRRVAASALQIWPAASAITKTGGCHPAKAA